MPWNGSGTAQVTDGTFTGTAIWTQEKNASYLVTAAHFDAFSNDLCNMFNNCFTIDGQVIGNILKLNATTNATTGVIQIGGVPALQMIGTGNVFAGNAGNFTFSGTRTVGFGPGALVSQIGNSDNTAVGYAALNSSTNGSNNTAVGSSALCTANPNSDNAAFGYSALFSNAGARNAAVGSLAGQLISSGGSNSVFGYNAGSNLTTGSNNIAIGAGCTFAGATSSGQINIGCTIFATGATTTGSAGGTGKVGINTNAPTYELEAGKGSIAVATAGQGFRVKEGTNAKQGTATLTAGTVVVSNTSVTANSRIVLTAQDNSSTGALRVSARTAGSSFTITSSNNADSGVVAYQIFEPY